MNRAFGPQSAIANECWAGSNDGGAQVAAAFLPRWTTKWLPFGVPLRPESPFQGGHHGRRECRPDLPRPTVAL